MDDNKGASKGSNSHTDMGTPSRMGKRMTVNTEWRMQTAELRLQFSEE